MEERLKAYMVAFQRAETKKLIDLCDPHKLKLIHIFATKLYYG